MVRIPLMSPLVHITRIGRSLPAGQVKFAIPMNMGKLQVKAYLTQVYSLSVKKVNIAVRQGKVKKIRANFLTSNRPFTAQSKEKKLPDRKFAFVTFAFPPERAMLPGAK